MSTAPVSLVDLYPTLVEMCDLPEVAKLDGQSLLPLLRDPSKSTDRVVITTFDLVQMRWLVTNDYKLVFYPSTDEKMLFDRRNDALELQNLADDPAYGPVVDKMMNMLLAELARTED